MGDTAYKAFRVHLMKDSHEVTTTFFHRKITNRRLPDDPSQVEAGGSVVSSVPRGKSFTLMFDLTRLYEITEPGMYTFDVSRTEPDNKTTIRSNTLTLHLVP
jgi:hypothetical protein